MARRSTSRSRGLIQVVVAPALSAPRRSPRGIGGHDQDRHGRVVVLTARRTSMPSMPAMRTSVITRSRGRSRRACRAAARRPRPPRPGIPTPRARGQHGRCPGSSSTHQDVRLHCASLGPGLLPAGRKMANAVPRPGLGETRISPPWASTILRATASPRPVPAALVVK
jgi:hypothetical protein